MHPRRANSRRRLLGARRKQSRGFASDFEGDMGLNVHGIPGAGRCVFPTNREVACSLLSNRSQDTTSSQPPSLPSSVLVLTHPARHERCPTPCPWYRCLQSSPFHPSQPSLCLRGGRILCRWRREVVVIFDEEVIWWCRGFIEFFEKVPQGQRPPHRQRREQRPWFRVCKGELDTRYSIQSVVG